VESVGVGDFRVVLVGNQPSHFRHLVHLFERGTSCAVGVLHRHENKKQVVVVLLDELVDEVSGCLDVGSHLEAAHVPLPLAELILDGLDFLKQFHFSSFFFSDAKDHFLCKIVPMRAFYGVGLISVHGAVYIGVI
jgi:hypothetical protein